MAQMRGLEKIYEFSVNGLTPDREPGSFPLLSKTLVRDLMSDLQAPYGAVIEKVEGLTVLWNGEALIVTDKEGVEDSNGKTQLINLCQLD
jgi:hypothetical protein